MVLQADKLFSLQLDGCTLIRRSKGARTFLSPALGWECPRPEPCGDNTRMIKRFHYVLNRASGFGYQIV